jgi:hypothetical protein
MSRILCALTLCGLQIAFPSTSSGQGPRIGELAGACYDLSVGP